MSLITRITKVAAVAGGLAFSTGSYGAELVTNGNFDAGLTGFTTTYQVGPPGPANQGNVYLNNEAGRGNYLNVDPYYGTTGYFFSQTFAVAQNSLYSFSVLLKSINGGSSPIFQALANGTEIVANTTISSSGFLEATGVYNSGNAKSVTLQLFNNNHEYYYNDLGVDNISFTGAAAAVAGVPEPATWAMMLIGFGALGGAMRRRKQRFSVSYA